MEPDVTPTGRTRKKGFTRRQVIGEVRVTFLGTTTLLIDDGTTQLLFDTFITDVPLHGSVSTINIGRGGDVPEAQLEDFRLHQPVNLGAFTVTALASKHSPGTKGGDGTPITGPLRQPAKAGAYFEGGSYDFHIRHGAHSILVKASAGYLPGGLEDVRADVMFCATAGSMGKDASFRQAFYEQAVATVRPKLFVPLHWNDFFHPVTDHLEANMKAIDNVAAGWDYLIKQLRNTNATFAPMQGYSKVILFGSTGRGV